MKMLVSGPRGIRGRLSAVVVSPMFDQAIPIGFATLLGLAWLAVLVSVRSAVQYRRTPRGVFFIMTSTVSQQLVAVRCNLDPPWPRASRPPLRYRCRRSWRRTPRAPAPCRRWVQRRQLGFGAPLRAGARGHRVDGAPRSAAAPGRIHRRRLRPSTTRWHHGDEDRSTTRPRTSRRKHARDRSPQDVTVRFGGLTALSDVSVAVPQGHDRRPGWSRTAPARPRCSACCPGCSDPRPARCSSTATTITNGRPSNRARLGLARTFQQLELFMGLTVREHVVLAYRVRTPAAACGAT